MPGFWEFPGGKCEAEESPRQATIRESLEEAGVAIDAKRLRRIVTHRYPHATVELHFFDCRPLNPRTEPAVESGFVWVEALDLDNLEFPGGNAAILRELRAEADRNRSNLFGPADE